MNTHVIMAFTVAIRTLIADRASNHPTKKPLECLQDLHRIAQLNVHDLDASEIDKDLVSGVIDSMFTGFPFAE